MVASALSTKKAVALFHALSDETRLELLDRLKDGEQCVCELTDAMKAAQSRLSFHLKVLKDAGLVEDRREGRWMYYRLSTQAIKSWKSWWVLSRKQQGRQFLQNVAADFLALINQHFLIGG